jgi:dolichyl-phosphate-mannose-protein mannosyltransferase
MVQGDKYMKKIVVAIIGMFLIIWCTGISVNAAENIVKNGSFENLDGGILADWYADIWDSTQGDAYIYIDSNSKAGSNSVVIQNVTENDTKLVQNVKVEPDTVYKLSGWIMAEAAGQGAKGANIGVLNIFETSEDFHNTDGQWQYVELYGRTGKKQKEMKVAVRLGGYGSTNTGKAYFDDLVVEPVEEVPANVTVVDFYNDNINKTQSKPEAQVPGILLRALLYAVIFACGITLLKKKSKLLEYRDPGFYKKAFIIIIATGTLLRLILAATTKGHTTDINCFRAWAQLAASVGLDNFYISDFFSDYPPGYIYVLYIIGRLREIFSIGTNSVAFITLLKLPAIAADAVCAYLVYKIGKKHLGEAQGVILGSLYILNPAVINNSAVWAQVDGVFTLFIVLMLYYILEDKLKTASVIFTIAVLVKPQALIFTPLLIFAFIRKWDIMLLAKSAAYSLLAFVIGILPFSIRQNPLWIIEQYMDTLKSYPYASVNAFNLFALSGGNWASHTRGFLFLDYKTWGLIFILAIVAYSTFIYYKSKDITSLTYIAFFIIFAVFVLSAKMHERYMFPALILGLIWYIYSKDKRALYATLGATLTLYVNVAYVLAHNLRGSNIIVTEDSMLIITALANMAILGYVIYLGIDMYCLNNIEVISHDLEGNLEDALEDDFEEKSSMEQELVKQLNSLRPLQQSPRAALNKRDFLLMAVLVVIYSAIAFVNLGSTKVPQTFWEPEAVGESIIGDLGKSQDISQIYYYPGVKRGEFSLEFSKDGDVWEDSIILDLKNMYKWNTIEHSTTTRYVRITALTQGGMLNEVGLFAPEGESPLAVTVFSVQGEGTQKYVFDEQHTVLYRPSYMEEMYFDEIYHARTAYEHIHRIMPYEWTHPPFGKILISIGILIFGMNPFGWRIIGTLFGVAMIPLIYIFAKKLFKKTEYAFIAAFLMTFDFMHFTQTRIATIDVYTVFFTILMYYFMYIYVQTDFFNNSMKKILLPLGLSGLFFGLGAATKWSCVYGGLGLAVIFFWDLYKKYLKYRTANELLRGGKLKDKGEEAELCKRVGDQFLSKVPSLIAWCVLFFIIIPVLLYFLSFIPYMLVPGIGFKEILEYQSRMYNYHSKLVAEHGFASSWWEWPTIVRPIWYYSGQKYLPPDKISSISSMGNPAIWWAGIGGFIGTICLSIKQKDRTMNFILIAAASQYLPWILIPRLTFIYHYFSTVPFMMLCIVYVFKYFKDRDPDTKYIIYGYLVIVVVLFIMFYPIMSGMVVSKDYVSRFLRWRSTWYFFS